MTEKDADLISAAMVYALSALGRRTTVKQLREDLQQILLEKKSAWSEDK